MVLKLTSHSTDAASCCRQSAAPSLDAHAGGRKGSVIKKNVEASTCNTAASSNALACQQIVLSITSHRGLDADDECFSDTQMHTTPPLIFRAVLERVVRASIACFMAPLHSSLSWPRRLASF